MPYPFGYQYDSTGDKCSGGPQVGMSNLARWAKAQWRLPLIGIFNCRPSRGGGGLSTHGEGRGGDLHVHTRASEAPPTPAERLVGDAMAAFFVAVAALLGVQRVIWLDREWNSRSKRWAPYSGPFHGNHVHVELCWESARQLTTADLNHAAQGRILNMDQLEQLIGEVLSYVKGMNTKLDDHGKALVAIQQRLGQAPAGSPAAGKVKVSGELTVQ